MKKIVSLLFALAFISFAFAQTKKDKNKISLANRAADHFMIQFSSDHWANLPDTINNYQKGFSRGLNIYFMLDKPFKTNPNYSIAFGLGIGSSNIFFQNMIIDLTNTGSVLPFDTTASANQPTARYKKYKLSTAFLEAPVELRYTAHPERESKSLKFALGLKFGVMLDAHTKGKDPENDNGGVIANYTQKISNNQFFDNTRLSATARVGYGHYSLFGTYQITPYLKPGAGPDIQFFQIGICLSGL